MSGAPVVLVLAPTPLQLLSPPGFVCETRALDCRCYRTDEHLHETLARERPDLIVSFGRREDYPRLEKAPHDVRRRWLHFDLAGDEPSESELERAGALAFCYYLRGVFAPANARRDNTPLVSVFTPTFRSGERALRAFRSLEAQTYDNWEWVVVDDSDDDGATFRLLGDVARRDPRVSVHAADRHSGRIGEVKRRACALARGDILVELDHDDELTPGALAAVIAGFAQHPDAGFVYTDWADVAEDTGSPLVFGPGWAFGFGAYRTETFRGRELQVAIAPPVNAITIRHIVGVPNHLRAWRRDVYWQIGGHNPELRVADDYELLVRTFLHTRMVHLPMLGYIQYLRTGANSQDSRRSEIQRLVRHISQHYDRQITDRARQLAVAAARTPRGSRLERPQARSVHGQVGCADLSVIVLDATASSLGVRCLESVREFCPGAEIVLVGNGVESPARHLADTYISLPANIGVAAGWNVAASRATRPYLCFLNDDARFVDERTPARLLAAAHRGAIAGPYSNRAKPPQGDVRREHTPCDDHHLDAVVGLCLVVERAVFYALGGFDPRFPMWDDDDFCARAKSCGVPSVVAGGAWVEHECHASFHALEMDVAAALNDGRRRYMQKHAPVVAVAIAKDEADAIEGYFDQFRDVPRELVLIDTGSSDGTDEIAARMGVRIEKGASVENAGFAEVRNRATAVAAAGRDRLWIIMFDPDERLDDDTIRAIPELIASAGDTFDVFLAPLEAVAADGTRRRFPAKPFMYRAGTCHWRYLVHEKLVGGRQAVLANARIEHHLKLHSPDRRYQAEHLYARLMAREPYFTDPAYRRNEHDAWPILDYERRDDPRLAKVHAGPLVSVVIPSFNRPQLCVRAVESALAQDWAPLEVIVVGDVCPSFGEVRGALAGHPRVRCIDLVVKQGGGRARNVGILAAAGDWIAYLDDDNTWDCDHVSSVMGAIRAAGASWGFSSMKVLDDIDLGFGVPARGGIDTSCLVHRKGLIETIGRWKSQEEAGDWEDWEFVSRLLAAGEPWAATRRPTLNYNLDTSSHQQYLRALASRVAVT